MRLVGYSTRPDLHDAVRPPDFSRTPCAPEHRGLARGYGFQPGEEEERECAGESLTPSARPWRSEPVFHPRRGGPGQELSHTPAPRRVVPPDVTQAILRWFSHESRTPQQKRGGAARLARGTKGTGASSPTWPPGTRRSSTRRRRLCSPGISLRRCRPGPWPGGALHADGSLAKFATPLVRSHTPPPRPREAPRGARRDLDGTSSAPVAAGPHAEARVAAPRPATANIVSPDLIPNLTASPKKHIDAS